MHESTRFKPGESVILDDHLRCTYIEYRYDGTLDFIPHRIEKRNCWRTWVSGNRISKTTSNLVVDRFRARHVDAPDGL